VISLPDRDSGSSEVGVEGNDRAVDELANELSKLLNISVNANKKHSAATTKVSLDGRIEEAFFFPEPQDSDTQFSHFLSFLRAPTKTLDIAVYTLSDMSIAQAIIDQHLAGVRVRIITDNDTSKSPGSLVQLVEEKGVAIMLDQSRFHMHHK
jgi:phosphatidylserine/phosphatidylglycerophosphate/cardiolipin synthase-like enzyme